MRHELVEREDVGEGSLDDDVATSVTLHFTKQDPVAMWLRSTASCKNGLLCSAEQKNDEFNRGTYLALALLGSFGQLSPHASDLVDLIA